MTPVLGVVASGYRAPSWSPLALPGLALWVDMADPSTITKTGANVSQVRDKSGNGRHFTVASGTPTLITAGRNGLDVLAFTSGAKMTAPTWGLTGAAAVTFFGVGMTTTSNRVWCSLGSNNYVALTHDLTPAVSQARDGVLFGGVVWWGAGPSPIVNAWALQTFSRASGSNLYERSPGSVSASGSTSPISQSGAVWLGGDSAGANSCQVAELIVGGATDSTQRANAQNYLRQKWGIAA